ncbi:MAG: hypothetical protein KGL10_03300 [Alphaproteobacteria bacterium]|nr:hypothetical protein [Alphaproteobacteria bacterium]
MSFFILAMGMTVAAGAPIYKEYNVNKRMNETNAAVANAQAALTAFYQQNGYYPCPAPRNVAVDHAGFGASVDCSQPAVPPGTVSAQGRVINGTPWKVRIGTLPVRTLGLPDKAVMDGWGHLLTYAVTENYTLPPVPSQQKDLLHGAITIVDSNNNSVTTNNGVAVYVVVAAGEDGRGAYNINGQQPVACPASGLVAENCNDDATFRATTLQSMNGQQSFTNLLAYGADPCNLTGGGGNNIGNVTFFVDNSGSMATRDVTTTGGPNISRMQAVHQALTTVIPSLITQKSQNDPTNLVGVANFSTYCAGIATSCNGNVNNGGCPVPHNPPTLADTQCLYNGANNSVGYSTSDISGALSGSTSANIASGTYQTVSNNLVNKVNAMQPTGDTPLYTSMVDTVTAMQNGQPNKPNLLVVVSDGGDNTSNISNTTMINTLATKYPNLKVDFVFVGGKQDCASCVQAAIFGKTPQGNQLKGNFIAVQNSQKILDGLQGAVNSCP